MHKTLILKGKKILFVEDDLFFSNMISLRLGNLGCVVINTIDGEETLSILEKEEPDLILLDLLLPGKIDGFVVLEKVKHNPQLRDIPVVILSNLSDTKDIERGMRLGAFRYLTKVSVTPNEIVDNINSALISRKM